MKLIECLFVTLLTAVSFSRAVLSANIDGNFSVDSILSYDFEGNEATYSPCDLCWKSVQFDSNDQILGSLDTIIQQEIIISSASNQIVKQSNFFYLDGTTHSYGIYSFKSYCSPTDCQRGKGKLFWTPQPFLNMEESSKRPSHLQNPLLLSNCGNCTLRWINETLSLSKGLLFPKINQEFIRLQNERMPILLLAINTTDKLTELINLQLVDMKVISSSMNESSFPKVEFDGKNETLDSQANITSNITVSATRQIQVTFSPSTDEILSMLPLRDEESRSLLLKRWPVNYTISSFPDEKVDKQLSLLLHGSNATLSNEKSLDVSINRSVPPSTLLQVFSKRIIKNEDVSFNLIFKVSGASSWSQEETTHALINLLGSRVQSFLQPDNNSSLLLSFPGNMHIYDESVRIFLNQTPVRSGCSVFTLSSALVIASVMSLFYSFDSTM